MGPIWAYRGNIMKKQITTKNIVTTGLLLALEVILQVMGNYLQFGQININVSLLAVVMAAALCGPLSGGIVGFFNGIMALVSPSTAFFMSISPIGTFITCLLKCTLAGVVAGLLFNLIIKKNRFIALIVAGLIVPIVNTGIFSICCFIFFRSFLQSGAEEASSNMLAYLLIGVIGINFIVEIIATTILSTATYPVIAKREKAA